MNGRPAVVLLLATDGVEQCGRGRPVDHQPLPQDLPDFHAALLAQLAPPD